MLPLGSQNVSLILFNNLSLKFFQICLQPFIIQSLMRPLLAQNHVIILRNTAMHRKSPIYILFSIRWAYSLYLFFSLRSCLLQCFFILRKCAIGKKVHQVAQLFFLLSVPSHSKVSDHHHLTNCDSEPMACRLVDQLYHSLRLRSFLPTLHVSLIFSLHDDLKDQYLQPLILPQFLRSALSSSRVVSTLIP